MTEKFLVVESSGAYEEKYGYGSTEFISTSAGAGDSGKPILLNASGLIDSSMVDASSVSHDGTSGAAASVVHTAFPLLDGTRDYTGIQSYSTGFSFTNDNELITKKYVDDFGLGFSWHESVLTRTATPPVSPSAGDRYLIIPTATGAWVGQEDALAEWSGSAWIYTVPNSGDAVLVADEPTVQYRFDGSNWISQSYESTVAGDGLTQTGNTIAVDPTLAGAGLGYAAGIMNVNVDDSSIEVATDTLQVKALGITDAMLAGSISDGKLAQDYIQTSEVDNVTIEFGTTLNVVDDGINALKIDWGLGANQVSAADIVVADSSGNTSEVNVEGCLSEIYGLIDESGVEYTSAGVTKGDLLYISANDTVASYSTISTYHKAVGLATATIGAGSPVRALANDTVLTAVLSGATAGDVYFWDGSSIVSTMPSTSGSYVIRVGIAKNATDLAVEVMPVKKNI